MKISVFTSTNASLTKRFEVVDGALQKTPLANFSAGTAETRDVGTPTELLALLDGLTAKQALAAGVLKVGTSAIITIASKAREGGGVARTLEHFHYPAGPGWMLWDFDNKTMPPEVRDRIAGLGGPVAALFHIWPEAVGAPYLIRPSSSGGVSAPGLPETQSDGLHGFFLIDEVLRSSEALAVLQARAWAAGLAWCALSKSGAVLIRSIVDVSVGSPERLIFEASPILIDPVIRTPKPAILSNSIVPVPVPSIDDATEAATKAAEAEARHAIKPEALRVEAEFIEDRARVDAKKTGKTIEEARRMVRLMLKGGVLSDDHLLQMRDGSQARVGDLLDAPERYDRLSLPDPIEGLSYGPDKATLLLRADPRRPDTPPRLVSHAHGVTTVYRFERHAQVVQFRMPQAAARKHAEPPHLPDATDARHQINAAVDAFFRVVDTHHGRDGISALIASEGPLEVIAAGLGLGKTTAAIRGSVDRLRSEQEKYRIEMAAYDALKRAAQKIKKESREELVPPKAPAVMVLVPEHRLSEQVASTIRASAPELTVVVLRGVDANDPDAPGEKVCKRLEEYREASALLLDPAQAVCADCSFATSCRAIASKAAKADVYIAAHGALTGNPAATLGWRGQRLDHVIIDESPMSALLFGTDPKNTIALAMAAWAVARSLDAQLDAVRAKLSQAVAANGPGPLRRDTLLAEMFSAEDAEAAAKAEWDRKVEDPHSEDIEENRTVRRAAGMWAEIVSFLQSGLPASGRLSVAKDAERGMLLCHRGVRPLRTAWLKTPTLMLDATAEVEIIRAMMGARPMRAVAIYAAEPMLTIRQDPRKSGAKSMLLEAKWASADGNRAARRKMTRLTKYLQRHAASCASRLLVIGNVDIINQLLPAMPNNIVTGHFGALRGLNDFEGIDRVVVIGRWLPSNDALEATAAALFGIPVDGKLDVHGTASRLARDRQGYYWHDGKAAIHSDARTDLVLRAIRDAEVEQAIGRARAVNASSPVDVILLSDAFVRQPVEIVDLWASVLKDDPVLDMIDAAGVALFSPAHAAEVFPWLWASKQAAQYALAGLKTTGQKTSYMNLYEEFCPVEYRTPKRAEVHNAFVDLLQHAVPVDAVRLLLPRVTEVRLAKPEPVKEAVADRPAQCNILPFICGGIIDLNLAAAAEDSADDITAGARETPPREQAEYGITHARRPDGGAEGDNTRVKRAITAQALPAPPHAAVVVSLPLRPDVELSWPADPSDADDIRVAPHMSVQGAELLIFRREPAGQVWDRARRAAPWAGYAPSICFVTTPSG